MPTAPLVDSRGGSISSDQGFYKANAKKMLKMFRKVLIINDEMLMPEKISDP